MNPFMLPEKERMLSWRELRNQIQAANDLDTKLNLLLQWWSKAPICRYSIDAFDSSEWPTPWELLNENMFCTSAISYMMAQTLALTGFEPSRLKLSFIKGQDDERLVLVVDEEITLNYSFGEVFAWSEILKEVRVKHTFMLMGEKYQII